MVTDDVTAIVLDGESPTVLPAFPQLKLWPEAVTSLGEAPETLPLIHPLFEKRAHRVTRGFWQRPLPLRRIYILGEGAEPTIESLHPHEAALELVRHWYGARFGDGLLRVGGAAGSHFRQCATLANRVPVRRLRRHHPIRAIQELARMIEDDVNGCPSEQEARVELSA
jgi:hypothetical protein